MKPQDQRKLSEAARRFAELRDRSLSLMLATVSADGFPTASYSPFVRDEQGNFYIFVSQLSTHTRELLDTRKASILLIKDEADSTQIFARHRISYACQAAVMAEEDPQYDLILNRMSKRFGSVVSVLRSLPDFVLFRLVPRTGRFVTGFGEAYELVGEHLDRLTFVDPEQIRNTSSSTG